jgi:hypothetical protein
MSSRETPGRAYEAVVHAGQRIRVVHWVLATAASFSLWNGGPIPHFDAFSRGAGWILIVLSILGWGPYLISWFYSRALLDGSSRAVNAFSVCAILVTLFAAGFYQNIFAFQDKPPAIFVSAAVTLSLVALAKLCSIIWRPI